jgi:hypothetical protein
LEVKKVQSLFLACFLSITLPHKATMWSSLRLFYKTRRVIFFPCANAQGYNMVEPTALLRNKTRDFFFPALTHKATIWSSLRLFYETRRVIFFPCANAQGYNMVEPTALLRNKARDFFPALTHRATIWSSLRLFYAPRLESSEYQTLSEIRNPKSNIVYLVRNPQSNIRNPQALSEIQNPKSEIVTFLSPTDATPRHLLIVRAPNTHPKAAFLNQMFVSCFRH